MIAAPSDRALLEWIQAKVSRPMLEEISLNDYGEESADHLAGIQAQLTAHPPLGMLPWCPREVLELERWNDPDHPYMDKPPSGARGHIKRLLACTILLRNGAYVSGPYGLSDEDFFPGDGTCPIGLSVTALNTPEWKAELGIPAEMTAFAPNHCRHPRW